jgi:thiol-disulfide isomerase/thioredoxin/uncharacterized membrane protein YphA (DoxX/SURF4 family)
VTGSDIGLFTTRILLSGIFLLAGISKLVDRRGSRDALIGFGVPENAARWFSVVLPVVECAVAVSLLPEITAWWGAVGALSMLTLFVIGIAVNLARGRRPPCHCFGQLHSAPVGWPTLGRNAILGGAAAFVVVYGRGRPNPGVTDWVQGVSLSQAVTSCAIVLCAALLMASVFLLIQVIRQQGRLLLRLEAVEGRLPMPTAKPVDALPPGLPVGARAPAFRLNDLDGGESSLEGWLKLNKPILLFFTHPGCGPCNSLLPDISMWHKESGAKLSVVVISEGTAADNLSKNLGNVGPPVLLQREREVAEAYQAYGTPAVVLVRTDGTIGSPVAMGAELVRQAALRVIRGDMAAGKRHKAGSSKSAGAAKLADITPSLQVRDTGGRQIPLSSFLGARPVVVLFWNPSCGFCQKMLPDLKNWDTRLTPAGPGLVVISSGTIDQNRAMRLQSPVLADPESTVAAALDVHGTPMAVLVDAEGCVASDVAAGQDAVLMLGAANADDVNGEFQYSGHDSTIPDRPLTTLARASD